MRERLGTSTGLVELPRVPRQVHGEHCRDHLVTTSTTDEISTDHVYRIEQDSGQLQEAMRKVDAECKRRDAKKGKIRAQLEADAKEKGLSRAIAIALKQYRPSKRKSCQR